MKLVGKFERIMYTKQGSVEITFSTAQRTDAETLTKSEGAMLDISISKHHERRTLRANAYFWTLLNALANKMSDQGAKPIKSDDIYFEYVRDYGKSSIVYLRSDAVESFCKGWRAQGLGWLAFPQKSNGTMVEVQIFYGSSVYNKEQMGRLIDAVVADCKEFGIETKTPNEIADMLSLMEV